MVATSKDEIKTLTTHYIDGAFVESHGREVVDTIKPTNGKVIARVMLADEATRRIRGAPSPPPSARSRLTAARQGKNARSFCADCMPPQRRASMS